MPERAGEDGARVPGTAPRASLWRRVFHRYWWNLGWSNKHRPNVPHATWSLCLSNLNLPRVRWHREFGGGFVCLDYGNGNSDPVFSIGFEWPHDEQQLADAIAEREAGQ